jgi:hypothetical protein
MHTLTAVGSWLKALRLSNKGLLLLALIAAMWQSVSPLEGKLRSGGQEISRFSRNVNIHTMFTRAHRQSFESHVHIQNVFKINFNIITPTTPTNPQQVQYH